MRILVGLMLMGLVVSGCQNGQRHAYYRAECTKAGYRTGTDAFDGCVSAHRRANIPAAMIFR